MKYPSLNKTQIHSKTLKLNSGLYCENNSDGLTDSLDICNNIYFKNGSLVTRKGLSVNNDFVFGLNTSSGTQKKGFTLTDTPIYYNKKYCKIGYTIWGSSTVDNIYFYLLSESGEVHPISSITHTSSVASSFYEIKNVFFLQRKPLQRSGIFAFITKANLYNGVETKRYEIYEYNDNSRNWILLSDSDYYTPTVYLNGRGEKYSEARSEDWVFDGTPCCPEDINLLGGRLYAYFSADGHSSGFKLPFSGLKFNTSIICKIYQDSLTYTQWTVPANANSANATFGGKTVTLNCDRTSGYFRFTCANAPYAVPNTGMLGGNDICFFCIKDTGDSFNRIVGSSNVYNYNSRYFLYGNEKQKNEIFTSFSESPLYFPESMSTFAGDSSRGVSAAVSFGSELLIFKDDGIFKITSNKDTGKSVLSVPVGIESDFLKPDKITCGQYSDYSHSVIKNTLLGFGNKLIWLGKDKKVYSLSGNKSITELSSPIYDKLISLSNEETESAFAVVNGDDYWLFINKTGYIMNSKKDGCSWYYVTLPDTQNYIGGLIINKSTIYIICFALSKTHSCLCSLDGTEDNVLTYTGTGNQRVVTKTDIDYNLKFRQTDLGLPFQKKNIKKLNLSLKGKNYTEIYLESENGNTKQHIGFDNDSDYDVSLNPFMPLCEKVSLEIKGTGPFALKKAIFEFGNK